MANFNFAIGSKIFKFVCTAFYLSAASIIYKHSKAVQARDRYIKTDAPGVY